MEYPRIHDFPPFYTKQPVSETWQKQCDLWCELLLKYAAHHRLFHANVQELANSPLFNNTKISRKASKELIDALLSELVKRGNAQWTSKDQTRLWLLWKSLDEWGQSLLSYASNAGMSGTLCTVYELLHGDATTTESFYGMDTQLFVRILEALEKRGRVQLMKTSPNPEEIGVKFQ